jgi:hypothetical protein
MVPPEFVSHRGRSNVERRTEKPLGENRNKLAVLSGINGTKEFRNCYRSDNDELLLFVQITK